jgi:hypothetical protein
MALFESFPEKEFLVFGAMQCLYFTFYLFWIKQQDILGLI